MGRAKANFYLLIKQLLIEQRYKTFSKHHYVTKHIFCITF